MQNGLLSPCRFYVYLFFTSFWLVQEKHYECIDTMYTLLHIMWCIDYMYCIDYMSCIHCMHMYVHMCIHMHTHTCTHSSSTKTLHLTSLASCFFLRREEKLTTMLSSLFFKCTGILGTGGRGMRTQQGNFIWDDHRF